MWWECQTCGQPFTGQMQTGLAEAWWGRVANRPEHNKERLDAAQNLANARYGDARYAESERINRDVYAVRRRVLGAEHLDTLQSAGHLAFVSRAAWKERGR